MPDLDERLVGRGAARLLLDQQREVLGEHRHQRAGVAGAHAAAQVGDQRAADLAVGAEHRFDAMLIDAREPWPRAPPSHSGRELLGARLADALGGDHRAVAPGDRAVRGPQHRARGLERRAA